jgi:hypothetical protein
MGMDQYKAFATTDIAQGFSNWGRAAGYESMQEAIDNALEQCVVAQKRDSIPSECRLYALGNIIVYDMSDAELRAATELYKTNKNATNADLPAN